MLGATPVIRKLAGFTVIVSLPLILVVVTVYTPRAAPTGNSNVPLTVGGVAAIRSATMGTGNVTLSATTVGARAISVMRTAAITSVTLLGESIVSNMA
jgi:hypothetical protein